MHIKVLVDPVSQQPWTVRIVEKGESYGLNNSLTHKDEDPLVEFYDARYPHTDLGQFVSRYCLSILLDRSAEQGLFLDSEPSWQLSANAYGQVHAWLKKALPLFDPAPFRLSFAA